MTIGEAIELVNRLVPNQVSDTDKVDWLSNCDLSIFKQIIKTHWIPVEDFSGYGPETDQTTVLLVPAPFDELYRWYLEMHIAGANGETARYNTGAEKYNAALQTYMDYVNRNFKPKRKWIRWW